MISIPAAVEVPLRIDQDGAVRVADTRVLLEVIIAAYQRGDTPEAIQHAFPTVSLGAVYAVIAYYLGHQKEVDDYIHQVEAEGEEIRRKFEALPTSKPLTRDMLQARLDDRKRKQE